MAANCRDWLTTLWSASYKGVPFYFESDQEEGGRGLIIHQFPMRDDPFVEDLGQAPRLYKGAAYVHGNDADRAGNAFAEMLATRGAGLLTVPIRGPVLVRCQTFKRSHARDKMGWVGFDLEFVREGFATSLASVPMLASQAFAAAEGAAGVLSTLFARSLRIAGQPDHVADAAVDGVAVIAGAIEATRTGEAVDPAASAKVRDLAAELVDQAAALLDVDGPPAVAALDRLYAAAGRLGVDAPAPAVIDRAAGARAVAVAAVAAMRGLADAMRPDAAARAMADLAGAFADDAPRFYASQSAEYAAANRRAVARLARSAAMTAYAEAMVRRTYRSRPDGVTARAEIAVRFDAEMQTCLGADDVELFRLLGELQGRAIAYITRLIADLAPVVSVEAARPMPSLWWAHRLYADPARSAELVDRNGVRHPSFMPLRFQALAR